MADRITLKSMRFHALAGVYPHEAEFAQPIEIDLTVEVGSVPDRTATDQPAVVDYTTLYATVASVIQSGHIGYLEDIAERVAAEALQIRGVSVAHVAVRKPHVPLPGPLEYAEVSITRPARG